MLRWADPVRHVYKKVIVRDGVVAGAVLLGDTSSVGVLTRTFDRATPLPPERLHLLFPGRVSAAVTADHADDDVVCTCNAETRATNGCGTCSPTVSALIAARRPAPAEV